MTLKFAFISMCCHMVIPECFMKKYLWTIITFEKGICITEVTVNIYLRKEKVSIHEFENNFKIDLMFSTCFLA